MLFIERDSFYILFRKQCFQIGSSTKPVFIIKRYILLHLQSSDREEKLHS